MIIEVAMATGRSPREVYEEESLRTMFQTWGVGEKKRARDALALVHLVAESVGMKRTSPSVLLRGGRADAASEPVRRAATPPPGGEMVGRTLRIHIDDPLVGAAWSGSHPSMQAALPRGVRRG